MKSGDRVKHASGSFGTGTVITNVDKLGMVKVQWDGRSSWNYYYPERLEIIGDNIDEETI